MRTHITILLMAWALLISFPGRAQTGGRITGRVTEAGAGPLDGATILLQTAADSALVKTALAGTDGSFAFDNLKEGNYRLRIAMIGFTTYQSGVIAISTGKNQVSLGDIMLAAGNKQLSEVVVNAARPMFEQKIDRTVVNVDAMISAAGTTALDVLSKSPGIQVDQNGNVSLRGNPGVVIFIDDKPTYLSGADLVNYLQSLPSGSLDQIEIMTNPPAKYDAAGGAGVINIKTKRTRVSGFNGGLNLGYTQGQLPKTNNSFNFNYRSNKLNFFGNGGYSFQNGFTDLDIIRRFRNPDESPRSVLDQNSYIRRKGHAFTGKAGLDYYHTDNATFGLELTGQFVKSSNNNQVVNNLLGATNQLDSVISADNRDGNTFRNGGLVLNYRQKYGKTGRELTAEANYINYRTQIDQNFMNTSRLADGTLKSQDLLTGNLPLKINIYAARTDYTHPIKGGRLDAGLKASFTETDNLAQYLYTANGVTSPDYDKSNHFTYKETISAAYVNLSRDWKRFSMQAGLRAESTLSDGYQSGNPVKPDSAFRRTYTNLFPTLYLSWKTDSASTHVFNLNYGKRISRPFYQDLNPFISPLDKFTFYVGNPFLKPSFTHNINLSYTYKNKITLSLAYARSTDNINETIEIDNGIYYSRRGNIGRQEYKTASVNASLNPAKWLTANVYTQLTNIHSVSPFYTGTLDSKGTYWALSPNFQFQLGKGWSTELNCNLQTRLTNAQFSIGTLFSAGGGIQKKVNAASTLRLTVSDMFYTRQVKGIINNLALTNANWINRSDSRTVGLVYSWRFGKTISNQRRYESKGSQEEQGRVRN